MKFNPKNVEQQFGDARSKKILEYVQKLEMENRYLKQGLKPNVTTQNLKSNLSELPDHLRPGNVDDINRVVWPFWFTTNRAAVAPNTSVRTSFTVTQEAAFIMLAIMKTVHKPVAGITTYIDPNNYDVASGNANNLSITIRDAQSTREFQSIPFELDHIGHPEFPTVLPTPLMFLQNSTVEVQFLNSDAAVTYYPALSFFGYRVRLDQFEKVMSAVTG